MKTFWECFMRRLGAIWYLITNTFQWVFLRALYGPGYYRINPRGLPVPRTYRIYRTRISPTTQGGVIRRLARSPSPGRSRSRTPHVQVSTPTLRRNQRCFNLAALNTKPPLVGNNNTYRAYRPTRMYQPSKTVYVPKNGYGYRPWPQHSVSAQVRNHQRTSLEPTFNGHLVVQLNWLQLSGHFFFSNCYDKRRGNHTLNRCPWCFSATHTQMDDCISYRRWIRESNRNLTGEALEKVHTKGHYAGRMYHPYCDMPNGIWHTTNNVPLVVYEKHIINVFPYEIYHENNPCSCHPNPLIGKCTRMKQFKVGLPSPMEMQQLRSKTSVYIPIPYWVTARTKKIKAESENLDEQITKIMKRVEDQAVKPVCGCGEKTTIGRLMTEEEERIHDYEYLKRPSKTKLKYGCGCTHCDTPIYWNTKEHRCMKCKGTGYKHRRNRMKLEEEARKIKMEERSRKGVSKEYLMQEDKKTRDRVRRLETDPTIWKQTLGTYHGCKQCRTTLFWSVLEDRCLNCGCIEFIDKPAKDGEKPSTRYDCRDSDCGRFRVCCSSEEEEIRKARLKNGDRQTTKPFLHPRDEPMNYEELAEEDRKTKLKIADLKEGKLAKSLLWNMEYKYGCSNCKSPLFWSVIDLKCLKCGGTKFIPEVQYTTDKNNTTKAVALKTAFCPRRSIFSNKQVQHLWEIVIRPMSDSERDFQKNYFEMEEEARELKDYQLQRKKQLHLENPKLTVTNPVTQDKIPYLKRWVPGEGYVLTLEFPVPVEVEEQLEDPLTLEQIKLLPEEPYSSFWIRKLNYGCIKCKTPLFWSVKSNKCLKCGETSYKNGVAYKENQNGPDWSVFSTRDSPRHSMFFNSRVEKQEGATRLAYSALTLPSPTMRPRQVDKTGYWARTDQEIRYRLQQKPVTYKETRSLKQGCSICRTDCYWSYLYERCLQCGSKTHLSDQDFEDERTRKIIRELDTELPNSVYKATMDYGCVTCKTPYFWSVLHDKCLMCEGTKFKEGIEDYVSCTRYSPRFSKWTGDRVEMRSIEELKMESVREQKLRHTELERRYNQIRDFGTTFLRLNDMTPEQEKMHEQYLINEDNEILSFLLKMKYQKEDHIWKEKHDYGCKTCMTPIYWSVIDGYCLNCGSEEYIDGQKIYTQWNGKLERLTFSTKYNTRHSIFTGHLIALTPKQKAKRISEEIEEEKWKKDNDDKKRDNNQKKSSGTKVDSSSCSTLTQQNGKTPDPQQDTNTVPGAAELKMAEKPKSTYLITPKKRPTLKLVLPTQQSLPEAEKPMIPVFPSFPPTPADTRCTDQRLLEFNHAAIIKNMVALKYKSPSSIWFQQFDYGCPTCKSPCYWSSLKKFCMKCGGLKYKDSMTYEDEKTLEKIKNLDQEPEDSTWKKVVGYGCSTCLTPMFWSVLQDRCLHCGSTSYKNGLHPIHSTRNSVRFSSFTKHRVRKPIEGQEVKPMSTLGATKDPVFVQKCEFCNSTSHEVSSCSEFALTKENITNWKIAQMENKINTDRKIPDPFPTPKPKIDNTNFKKEMEPHLPIFKKIDPEFAKEMKQMIETNDRIGAVGVLQKKYNQLKAESEAFKKEMEEYAQNAYSDSDSDSIPELEDPKEDSSQSKKSPEKEWTNCPFQPSPFDFITKKPTQENTMKNYPIVPSPFDFMPIQTRQHKRTLRKYKVVSTKVKRPLALTPTSVQMKKSKMEDCTHKWDIAYNRHIPGVNHDLCKDCGKLRYTNPATIVPFPPTSPFKDYIGLIEEEEKRLGAEEVITKDEGLVHRITQRMRPTTADLSILFSTPMTFLKKLGYQMTNYKFKEPLNYAFMLSYPARLHYFWPTIFSPCCGNDLLNGQCMKGCSIQKNKKIRNFLTDFFPQEPIINIPWYERDPNTHPPHLNTKLEPHHHATRVNQEDFLAQVKKISPGAHDHRYWTVLTNWFNPVNSSLKIGETTTLSTLPDGSLPPFKSKRSKVQNSTPVIPGKSYAEVVKTPSPTPDQEDTKYEVPQMKIEPNPSDRPYVDWNLIAQLLKKVQFPDVGKAGYLKYDTKYITPDSYERKCLLPTIISAYQSCLYPDKSFHSLMEILLTWFMYEYVMLDQLWDILAAILYRLQCQPDTAQGAHFSKQLATNILEKDITSLILQTLADSRYPRATPLQDHTPPTQKLTNWLYSQLHNILFSPEGAKAQIHRNKMFLQHLCSCHYHRWSPVRIPKMDPVGCPPKVMFTMLYAEEYSWSQNTALFVYLKNVIYKINMYVLNIPTCRAAMYREDISFRQPDKQMCMFSPMGDLEKIKDTLKQSIVHSHHLWDSTAVQHAVNLYQELRKKYCPCKTHTKLSTTHWKSPMTPHPQESCKTFIWDYKDSTDLQYHSLLSQYIPYYPTDFSKAQISSELSLSVKQAFNDSWIYLTALKYEMDVSSFNHLPEDSLAPWQTKLKNRIKSFHKEAWKYWKSLTIFEFSLPFRTELIPNYILNQRKLDNFTSLKKKAKLTTLDAEDQDSLGFYDLEYEDYEEAPLRLICGDRNCKGCIEQFVIDQTTLEDRLFTTKSFLNPELVTLTNHTQTELLQIGSKNLCKKTTMPKYIDAPENRIMERLIQIETTEEKERVYLIKTKINYHLSSQEKFEAVTTLRGFIKALKKLDSVMTEDYVKILQIVLLQFDNSFDMPWLYAVRDIYEGLCEHFKLDPVKHVEHFNFLNLERDLSQDLHNLFQTGETVSEKVDLTCALEIQPRKHQLYDFEAKKFLKDYSINKDLKKIFEELSGWSLHSAVWSLDGFLSTLQWIDHKLGLVDYIENFQKVLIAKYTIIEHSDLPWIEADPKQYLSVCNKLQLNPKKYKAYFTFKPLLTTTN